MKRNAIIITLINGLVTAIQIVGQIIVARMFGAKVQLDAFVSAVTIPTILTSVIAGTLSDALLPLLKKRQVANTKKADVYFFKLLLLTSFVVLLVSVGLHIFSVPLLLALFGARGTGFIGLTNGLMTSMLYTLPFTIVGTFSIAYLLSQQRFIISSLAYLLGSILNLGIIVVLSPHIGIVSMVVGFVAAIIFQLFIVFPYKITGSIGKAVQEIFHQSSISDLMHLLIAWSPLIVSSLVLRFDNVLARSFSARLPEGYIVYVNLVTKLFAGLVGIMTIGIQTVFYPHLVDLIHTKKTSQIKAKVVKAKLFGIALSVGTVLFIVITAPFFMRLLLTGGKFSGKNVEILISLFPYFILPAIGWGIAQLFFQPIIAIGKQHIVTIINIGAVVLSWTAASLVYPTFGGLVALSVGLIVLTFTGIIGAEILWRKESKLLS